MGVIVVVMIVLAMLVMMMVMAVIVRCMVMRGVIVPGVGGGFRRVGMSGIGAAFGIERRLDLDDARP